MGISIEDKLRESLARCEAGDGIYVSIIVDEGATSVFQISVLRRDGELLFLSYPTKDFWNDQLEEENPFCWDASKFALVGRDGNIPEWYSLTMTIEKGVAYAAASRYALVPRLSDDTLSADDNLYVELSRSPLMNMIEGMLQNSESGYLDNQIYLFFEKEIGWTPNVEQLTKITLLYSSLVAFSLLNTAQGDVDEIMNETSDDSDIDHWQLGDWQDEYSHGQQRRLH